jgi:hypothetical protein
MNRRQMLQYGIQRLNRVVPAILSTVAGMGGLLNETEKNPPPGLPACFPGSQKKRVNPNDPQTTSKEEVK